MDVQLSDCSSVQEGLGQGPLRQDDQPVHTTPPPFRTATTQSTTSQSLVPSHTFTPCHHRHPPKRCPRHPCAHPPSLHPQTLLPESSAFESSPAEATCSRYVSHLGATCSGPPVSWDTSCFFAPQPVGFTSCPPVLLWLSTLHGVTTAILC